MMENTDQTFLTTIPTQKQSSSSAINDYEDEIDIDVKSSADSEDDAPMVNNEIDEILNKNQSQELSSLLIPNNDNLQDKM